MSKIYNRVLSISADAKTSKGKKYGFLTGILYFLPSNQSGYQVCPMAGVAKCESGCLVTAGRGAMGSVAAGRLRKTLAFHEDRDAFLAGLVRSIEGLVRKAKREGLTPLVRLNGTSDIRWELIEVSHKGKTFPNIFAVFPDVQFYDYTKISNRHSIPANYDLTFSYSGVWDYQKHVDKAIAKGMRVAVVFRNRDDIPARFRGLECVNGDDSDIRHLDPQGVCVALYAKGQAKTDYSGFVVDPARVIPIALAA